MKRLAALLALLLLGACSTDPATPPPNAVAEVRIPGRPPALTHGNDPLPARPPALAAQSMLEAAWPCEGNGSDGRRVQLLYLHGGGSSLATMRPTIETWARQVEGMFASSARATGGERLVRFVTDAGCGLSIIERTVSANALGSFDAMIDELWAAGLNRSDRAYHAIVESNAYCGIGTIYNDSRPTGNQNEANAHFGRTDRPCASAHTIAHEVIHNLGGVQNDAPNATGGFHCNDEADVMCYADGAPRGQMRQVCPPEGEDRLDCRSDDYFSATPAPGGYLAGHWNVANSSALSRSSSPTTVPPLPPTTSTTVPPTTSTSVGKGKTTTELEVPSRLRQGEAFEVGVRVTGDCNPTGVVAIYVSGRLMSRQVLANGDASVTLTMNTAASRPTIRADYLGDERCAPSRDSVRRTVRA